MDETTIKSAQNQAEHEVDTAIETADQAVAPVDTPQQTTDGADAHGAVAEGTCVDDPTGAIADTGADCNTLIAAASEKGFSCKCMHCMKVDRCLHVYTHQFWSQCCTYTRSHVHLYVGGDDLHDLEPRLEIGTFLKNVCQRSCNACVPNATLAGGRSFV